MINQAQSEPSEALTLKPSTWHMRYSELQSGAIMINQAQSEALTLKPSTWHMRYSPVPSFALTNRTRPSWARLAC